MLQGDIKYYELFFETLGNSLNKEKALVVWSGLNDPLYFSENAYFYVGDTTSKVTGFGKQSNMLVIQLSPQNN